MTRDDPDGPRYQAPLDEVDPRFGGPAPTSGERAEDASRGEPPRRGHHRELVTARGPFPDPDSSSARFARLVIPAIAIAGAVAIVAVFVAGLGPGSGIRRIGDVDAVRAAVADRPQRVCYEGSLPCAWLTLAGDELVALNTSGPLPEEYGRAGVGWCASAEVFGSNATGSRYDRLGNVLAGPTPRGLDRYGVTVDEGVVSVNFFSLSTGARTGSVEPGAPTGPDCESIPFDRDADLVLE